MEKYFLFFSCTEKSLFKLILIIILVNITLTRHPNAEPKKTHSVESFNQKILFKIDQYHAL